MPNLGLAKAERRNPQLIAGLLACWPSPAANGRFRTGFHRWQAREFFFYQKY
jgi:hypothetical protein